MSVGSGNYILYYFYPLGGLPRTFHWPFQVSALIAVAIGLLFGSLMYVGVRDAGEETMTPKKEHEMYGGIYNYMRHPQAVGEMPCWWALAFGAHSPFLVLWSFVYVPIWYYFAVAEEQDLILRYGASYPEYRERVGWFPSAAQVWQLIMAPKGKGKKSA